MRSQRTTSSLSKTSGEHEPGKFTVAQSLPRIRGTNVKPTPRMDRRVGPLRASARDIAADVAVVLSTGLCRIRMPLVSQDGNKLLGFHDAWPPVSTRVARLPQCSLMNKKFNAASRERWRKRRSVAINMGCASDPVQTIAGDQEQTLRYWLAELVESDRRWTPWPMTK
jgi:hypothetical protein